MAIRHFTDLHLLDAATLRRLLDEALAMKKEFRENPRSFSRVAEGAVLAMMFAKPSTRTRVSFDVAMRQLGGETVVLNSGEMQLGRGETIADTARVLSRYVDIIMLRTTSHQHLLDLAEHADVPVINGLTDRSHPCQIFADIMTFEELKGPIKGRKVAWVGDATNNVATSWIQASAKFGFTLSIACPKLYEPSPDLLEQVRKEGGDIRLTEDPREGVAGTDCVVTDVWVSMGDKDEERRIKLFQNYQVNAALMDQAAPDAIFMHCLPAQRGREVTDEVIDGPRSVVFDEAENRMHGQRAILRWCLKAD